MTSFGVTLTGVDEWTPLATIEHLAELGAEIGILFSLSNTANRYPDLFCVKRLVEMLGARCAVHVCGSKARDYIRGSRLHDFRGCGRIQLNGKATCDEVEDLVARSGADVITQDHASNSSLRLCTLGHHQILVDGSGGRGALPPSWARPDVYGDKRVGFAGGLGPDNIAEQLPLIAKAASKEGRIMPWWWIDMESGLRDKNDRFDVGRAMEVMVIANDFRCAL